MQANSPEELVYDILKLLNEGQFVTFVRLKDVMGCTAHKAKEFDKPKTLVRRRVSGLIRNRHLAARVEDLRLHRTNFKDRAEDVIDSLMLWNKLAISSSILLECNIHSFFVSPEQAVNIFGEDLKLAKFVSVNDFDLRRYVILDKTPTCPRNWNINRRLVVLFYCKQDENFKELVPVET